MAVIGLLQQNEKDNITVLLLKGGKNLKYFVLKKMIISFYWQSIFILGDVFHVQLLTLSSHFCNNFFVTIFLIFSVTIFLIFIIVAVIVLI